MLAITALPMLAQPEVRASFGSHAFVDDGTQNHMLVSGGVRYYFYKNLAVEGEYQYLRLDKNHYDQVLMPLVVWDARSRGRVIPYFLGGVGLMRTTQKWEQIPPVPGFPGKFTSNDALWQGGFGVKIFLSEHWYVAPEVRAGFAWHGRVSGSIGYSWKKR
ncbi:hypothetical protein F183_A14800 [Bryobacterales bacterium F-183]|nr:hypothetical protein F183_A14800 [Bryobacterales bacterium F-183]